jgi:hypothetical protein
MPMAVECGGGVRRLAGVSRSHLAPMPAIEAKHSGHHRVERAVMEIEGSDCAERMREGMHCTKALLESHGPFQCAHHHVVARFLVVAVGYGVAERAPALGKAVACNGIGGRIEGACHVSFQTM